MVTSKSNLSFQMIAKTLSGLEEILADELHALSATDITTGNRVVTFTGTIETLYKANLYSRTALRILRPLERFTATTEDELYQAVHQMDWGQYLQTNDTLAVDSFVSSENFGHSKYVALKVKDAIVDHFLNRTGRRPSVEVENPDLRINIHISGENCTLSLDSSGKPLSKRGYRLERTPAPLNEALAAGIILLSGWQGDNPFVDPMCGSGTFLIEAAMLAKNMAPGIFRKKFGFMRWRDYDENLWMKIREKAHARVNALETKILGGDISGQAVEVASQNIKRIGFAQDIKVKQGSMENFLSPLGNGILITNPPYGERLKKDNLDEFYKMIGDTLKQNYTGYAAWVLSGNKSALQKLGLRTSKKMTLWNGALECKLHKYELYKGSVKKKYADKSV